MDAIDAILEFPVGTRVRLSSEIISILGGDPVAEHGVGIVTGPIPDTDDWREWSEKNGGCVMVQWPESKIPDAIVPANVRYLVRVEAP